MKSHTAPYWQKSIPQIPITERDLDKAASDSLITKVFLLDESSIQDRTHNRFTILERESKYSKEHSETSLEQEADQKGAVLVVLSLFPEDQSVPIPKPESNAAKEQVSSAKPENVTRNIPDVESVKFVTELPTKKADLKVETTRLELELAALEKDVRESGLSIREGELTRPRMSLATARRKQQLLSASYKAGLRDLELQKRLASIEVDSAKEKLSRVQLINQKQVVTERELNEAKTQAAQAELSLERIQIQIDHYKNAGEGLFDAETTATTLNPETHLDSKTEELNRKKIWDRLGLKCGDPVTTEKLAGTKYRGGLPIVEIRSDSSTTAGEIIKGDILVGLEKWETMSIENVSWVLGQLAQTSDSELQKVKFFIVRGTDTRYGYLTIEQRVHQNSVTNPSSSSPQKNNAERSDHLSDDMELTRKRTSDLIRDLLKDGAREPIHKANALFSIAGGFDPETPLGTDIHDRAFEAIRSLDRRVIAPVLADKITNGSSREKYFAMRATETLFDLTSIGSFPAVAKEVFRAANDEEKTLPRLIPLKLLVETLPVTALDPETLTTSERKAAVQKLTDAVPRKEVIDTLSRALSSSGDRVAAKTTDTDEKLPVTLPLDSSSVSIVLESISGLFKVPESELGPELNKRVMDVLCEILKGKLRETSVSGQTRKDAFAILLNHGPRCAATIPTLIELMLSDDKEFQEINREPRKIINDQDGSGLAALVYTVVNVALMKMGPSAMPYLPELQKSLEALRKKEQEDAILSPNSEKNARDRHTTASSALNRIIERLKDPAKSRQR
ncbi:MAG: hypothetical protein FJ267_00880 [Planctomycetes bacterium]|nr:hypothetical protein [Planctomycetota bacterium]